MKNNNIILVIVLLMISALAACTNLKGSAKEIVSEKLHKYTSHAISKLIKTGIKDNLPPEIAKIIPVLNRFGLNQSITDLDKTISKLTVKPVRTAEKLMHHAIDEMTLIDAIRLLTTAKAKSPMTRFLKDKTENIVNNKIKSELSSLLSNNTTMNMLNKSISTYSKLNKNEKQNDIAGYVSNITTAEIFKYIAEAEKSDK